MSEITILDGAMGTMLQSAGMPAGASPEVYGLEHPDEVEAIHRAYIAAGARVIYANTFGANARKLRGGHTASEVIRANVAAARRAADAHRAAHPEDPVRVTLDIGPTGELMAPLGTLSFEDAYDSFAEMVRAGAAAGVDILLIETMTDLAEARAAVLAARECAELPVWVTMSFEENGRTFTGTPVAAMAVTMDGLGVNAMGINCSLGPAQIRPLMEEMRRYTDRPLIVKPNAGLPDPATGVYGMDAAEFARQMRPYAALGVEMLGGCCGTTPAYIEALRDALADDENGSDAGKEKAAFPDAPEKCRALAGTGTVVPLDGRVHVIGERINPTGKKRFAQALVAHDMNEVALRATQQADAGAEILDINVGLPEVDEPALMAEAVRTVQSVVSLPLMIDSSDPAAIEAGLRACTGRAIVNSVNAEPERLAVILPIVKKYGAAVVGLTLDGSGMPQTAEERFALAERIVAAAEESGIPREDVLIDCLTLTISAQQEQAEQTLAAVRMVRERLGTPSLLGVSNISFGLPQRSLVTVSFLTQALHAGLTLPILNPNQTAVMDAVAAYRALSGEDAQCEAYIERLAGRAESAAPIPTGQAASSGSSDAIREGSLTLAEAVRRGLPDEVRARTRELLTDTDAMDVINEHLIPALDAVGEDYGRGELFLPQLIGAANAACAGFDLIKETLASAGSEAPSKGTIILATVEGDIHDIGKNIVRVVLENYGYRVVDLGRDVPVRDVVDAAVREDARLVGLSALMTTTVPAMRRTIEALRASGHPCRVMVGGAVLTAEYAAAIGADFYTKDAKEAADVAREVFASE